MNKRQSASYLVRIVPMGCSVQQQRYQEVVTPSLIFKYFDQIPAVIPACLSSHEPINPSPPGRIVKYGHMWSGGSPPSLLTRLRQTHNVTFCPRLPTQLLLPAASITTGHSWRREVAAAGDYGQETRTAAHKVVIIQNG